MTDIVQSIALVLLTVLVIDNARCISEHSKMIHAILEDRVRFISEKEEETDNDAESEEN